MLLNSNPVHVALARVCSLGGWGLGGRGFGCLKVLGFRVLGFAAWRLQRKYYSGFEDTAS